MRRPRGLRGDLAATLALVALAHGGCPSLGVAPAGLGAAAEGRPFAVVDGRDGALQLAVSGRRWAVPPQKVLLAHSPLWVEVVNTSAVPIRFRPEDFVLELDGVRITAEDPEAVVRRGGTGSLEETRLVRSQGLRPRTLRPGESTRGFVFFRRRFSADTGPMRLRFDVFDDAHARALDWVEVTLEPARED